MFAGIVLISESWIILSNYSFGVVCTTCAVHPVESCSVGIFQTAVCADTCRFLLQYFTYSVLCKWCFCVDVHGLSSGLIVCAACCAALSEYLRGYLAFAIWRVADEYLAQFARDLWIVCFDTVSDPDHC